MQPIDQQRKNMAPHAPNSSGAASCGAALRPGMSTEQIILTPAELAQIVAQAVAAALASAGYSAADGNPSRPMTPAEKQRRYRARKKVESVTSVTESVTGGVTSVTGGVTSVTGGVTSVTEKVTREPGRVTESVTSVTEKVTREPGRVTESVTDKVTPQNLNPPSLPLPPQTPPSPAHPPALSSACVREEPGEMLPFDDIPPPEAKPKKSTPPPLAEWLAYAATLSPRYDAEDATTAWNHYEANGWRVGKNPAKDWRACCRTCYGNWKREERQRAARRIARKPEREPPHGIAAQNALAEYQ